VVARSVPEAWPIRGEGTSRRDSTRAYDLFGNAKTALKFSAGKFMKQYGELEWCHLAVQPARLCHRSPQLNGRFVKVGTRRKF
jgi:hypothetical protein